MTLRVDPGRSIVRRTLLAGISALLVPLPALAQTATKEKVAAALPKLKEFARQIVDKQLVPGLSIAVVHRDEIVLLDGFGVREIGKPAAVDVDTVFQLASVSKPLSATVVAGLVSDGKVSWDSRIRDIDPGFTLQDELAAANVTIRDLFAHRSGLPGPCRRRHRGAWLHPGRDPPAIAPGEAGLQLPQRLLVQQFRPDRGRRRGGAVLGKKLGGDLRGEALQAAWHELDQLALSGLHEPGQSRRLARPRRRRMGVVHPAQCRCAGSGGRRKLELRATWRSGCACCWPTGSTKAAR